MKFKKLSLFTLLIFICTNLSACWDKIEIEEEGYVAAIGLDKGEENKIRITFQITNPKAAGTAKSEGSSGEKKFEVVSFDAIGPLTARDISTITITRRIDLSHAKVIIIGEAFARTDDFFHTVESALRDKQFRRAISIMVSVERAEDFIKNNQPVLEDRMQKFYEFMNSRWKDTGLVPLSDLNRFMQRTEQGEGLFISIYGSTKRFAEKKAEDDSDYLPGEIDINESNNVEIIGSAVFKEGKMIGKLTGEETRLATLLREIPEVQNFAASFPDPSNDKYRIEGRVTKKKRTKIYLDLSGDTPKVDVTVPISIEILSIPSFVDYVENKPLQEKLKIAIEDYLQQKTMSLVEKTQSIYKGDSFMWELQARSKFLTYDAFKQYGWMERYPGADISIKYKVKLVGFGKQLSPPKVKKKIKDIETE